jgi:hypothetical protein
LQDYTPVAPSEPQSPFDNSKNLHPVVAKCLMVYNRMCFWALIKWALSKAS